MEEEQIDISIVCDKGFAAQFLRELAMVMEESDEQTRQYETYHGCAEIN